METLSVGRIVQYVLSKEDVEQINRRRVEGVGHGKDWPQGAQAHVGNQASAGAVVPAIVVWPHHNEDSTFNGQAFLDGNDVLWITSVPYSAESKPRTWHWPARV